MIELKIELVQDRGTEQLVVDSRLVAESLGVEHRQWINHTINKHLEQMTEAFGVSSVKWTEPNKGSAGGRPQKYLMLTEDQATFLMTLSRNTPQVVAAKVHLVKSFSKAKQLLLKGAVSVPEPKALKPAAERIAELRDNLEYFGIDVNNPRYSQAVKDLAGDMILGTATLPPSRDWVGVVERAEELGHLVPTSLRSGLGKYVKNRVPSTERTTEHRVCNGTQRPINLYRVTPALDQAIHIFFQDL